MDKCKHIFDEMKTYDEYVQHEFESGNILHIDEIYFSEEDFNEYKKNHNNAKGGGK